ncbi:hypothetical protein RBA16_27405, partial [Mycobacteroides abscessus subsp. massiliense]|uniref:hypothetical protein n=1 Tax=Mycobacteroides abscessus TaxID=36809 RepID=UPI003CF063E0
IKKRKAVAVRQTAFLYIGRYEKNLVLVISQPWLQTDEPLKSRASRTPENNSSGLRPAVLNYRFSDQACTLRQLQSACF